MHTPGDLMNRCNTSGVHMWAVPGSMHWPGISDVPQALGLLHVHSNLGRCGTLKGSASVDVGRGAKANKKQLSGNFSHSTTTSKNVKCFPATTMLQGFAGCGCVFERSMKCTRRIHAAVLQTAQNSTKRAGDLFIWLWLKKPVPKWNPGKWKHGPKPA